MRPMPKAGMEMNSISTLIRIDQVKSGIWSQPTPGARMVATVAMKLIPVSVEDATSMICPASHMVAPGWVLPQVVIGW